MEKILQYLQETYHPVGILVYGSFAEGTEKEGSDFDAILEAKVPQDLHDSICIEGTRLDVCVYTPASLAGFLDGKSFCRADGGKILKDESGAMQKILDAAAEYFSLLPLKTAAEKAQAVDWCEKMRQRTSRRDAEGFFRWHWVLTESLEIFCEINDSPYRGPKKALRYLQSTDPEGYALYETALCQFRPEALRAWISHLRERIK